LTAHGGLFQVVIRLAAVVRYRPEEFKVYFTQNEKEYAREKAESVHMSLSSYARKMILDGAVIYRDVSIYAKCLTELNAIGKNINQIAHNTNSVGVTTGADVNQLKREYEKLKELYIQLLGDMS